MFIDLTTLDANAHRGLRFSPNQPYDFARQEVLIPVVSGELSRVAREMPIVFPVGSHLPHALVGVTPGENLYVKDSGHWVGRYVPAHLRRYPFKLAMASTQPDPATGPHYALQFDASARHFERPDGHALLDASGQPTAVLKKVQQVLAALQIDQDKTQALVTQLEHAGLLREQRITVKQGEDKKAIGGVRLVDTSALGTLDAPSLAALRDSGALALAYAHQLSLTNLHDSVLTQATSGDDAVPHLDQLFNEGDDDFSFDFDS